MQVFKVRMWDSDRQEVYTREVDLENVVRNPYGMHINDSGIIALNELRRQRGLPPLPEGTIAENPYER